MPSQFWVATNGVDSSAGTEASPFATVNHAIGVAAPGDTIVIRNGSYNQRVLISNWNSGSASNKLTIKAENAGLATLAGVSNTSYVVEITNSKWIVIQDLIVQYNSGHTIPSVRNHPIYIHNTATDIRVTNCSVTKLGLAPTETAMKNDYNAGYRDVGVNMSGTTARIEVDHCTIRGVNRCIAADGTATFFYLHHNRLSAVQSCINIRYGNYVFGSHYVAFNDIEYSYMEDGTQNQPDPANPAGTIDTSGFFYYRNIFRQLGENAIDTKGTEHVFFTKNVFYGNFGNNNGRHPTMQTIGGSPLMVTCGANQETRHRVGFDNVFYDNSAGPAVWQADCYYNNLVWYNRRRDTVSGSGTSLANYKGFAYTEGSGFDGIGIKNNVIGRQYYGSSLRDYAATNIDINGNAYINCDNVGFDAQNSVAKATLANWRTYVQGAGWTTAGEANSYSGTDAATSLFTTWEEYPTAAWNTYNWSVKPTATPLYHQGVALTTATSATTSSVTLPVANANYFYGNMGRADLPQQDIYIAGVGTRKVVAVNWTTKQLTLNTAATVANGAAIYHGTSATPDIGTMFFEVGPDAVVGGGGGSGGTPSTITAGTVASYALSSATNTFSFGATIPSGSDLALFVVVLAWKTSETAFTVAPTFNGAAMTEVYTTNTITTSRYYLASIWRKLNPAVGAGTVAGTYSSNANDQVVFAVPLIGVDTPTGVTGNDTTGVDWAAALTTGANNAWLLGGLLAYGGDNVLTAVGEAVKDGQAVTGASATADITGGLFHLMCGAAGLHTLQATSDDTRGLFAAVEVYAVPGSTDALTATNITTGAPTLTVAVLGQTHALVAVAIFTGVPTLTVTTIGQVHVLAAISLTAGVPTLAAGSLGQTHILTAINIATGAPTLSTPELVSDYPIFFLVATDITTGAPTLTAGALGQTSALMGADITTGAPLLTVAVLAQTHALVGVDILFGAPVLTTPTASMIHTLVATNIVVDDWFLPFPDLGQIHILVALALMTGISSMSAAGMGQTHILVGQDITTGAPSVGSASKIVYEFIRTRYTVRQPHSIFTISTGV